MAWHLDLSYTLSLSLHLIPLPSQLHISTMHLRTMRPQTPPPATLETIIASFPAPIAFQTPLTASFAPASLYTQTFPPATLQTILTGAPGVPSTPNAPRTKKLQVHRPHLTRDERIEVLALRRYGKWSATRIAKELDISYGQVQWALSHRRTPQHTIKCGYKTVLFGGYEESLITFVTSSRLYRNMTAR